MFTAATSTSSVSVTTLHSAGDAHVPAASVIQHVNPGTSVEVLSNYSGRWVPGFNVIEVAEMGYRLRRRSDHSELPVWFHPDEVRIVEP